MIVRVAVALTVADAVAVPVADAVGVAVAEAVTVTVALEVGLGVAVAVVVASGTVRSGLLAGDPARRSSPAHTTANRAAAANRNRPGVRQRGAEVWPKPRITRARTRFCAPAGIAGWAVCTACAVISSGRSAAAYCG